MIRAAIGRSSGFVTRRIIGHRICLATTSSSSSTNSPQQSQQLASDFLHRSHETYRLFSSVQEEEYDGLDEIPSNLKFDKKSSFAPKPKPLFVNIPDMDEPETTSADNDDAVQAKEDDEGIQEKEDGEEESDDYDDDDYDDDFDDNVEDGIDDSPKFVIPLPDRLKTDIRHGLDGSVTGSLWLEPSVWGIDPIRVDLIKQNVVYIRNKIRGRRKAKTKTISEVSGSGRKVRQQKGTGSARAGHSRPAHWRGGAKAHGPKNTRDYGNIKMNKKSKRLAICSALSQKLKEGNVILIDNLRLDSHKTSPFASLLDQEFGIGKDGSSAFILDHYYEPGQDEKKKEDANEEEDASYHGVPINLWVASGNIYKVKVANQRFCNVYDILRKEKLVLTLGALEQIEARWKN